jgi:hypothetical protein
MLKINLLRPQKIPRWVQLLRRRRAPYPQPIPARSAVIVRSSVVHPASPSPASEPESAEKSISNRFPPALGLIWILGAIVVATTLFSLYLFVPSLFAGVVWEPIIRTMVVIAVILGLIYLVYKAFTTKQAKYWGLATAMLFVTLVIWGVASQYTRGAIRSAPQPVSTITVGHEWSPVIRVPLGGQVRWQSDPFVAYQIKNQVGDVYQFDKGDECRYVPGVLSSFRMRIVESGIESAPFEFQFSRIEPGGPCGEYAFPAEKVSESTPAPLPLEP